MERPVGLRERKKAATRQAVHRAALRLAVEHGFDRVTVEAIAEAADISRRTFSNYFADKEDALLHGDEQRMRAMVAEARRRPAQESGWAALRGSVRALFVEAEGEPPPDRDWRLRSRLARRHPSLLERQLAQHAALARDLEAAVIGRRTANDVRPAVLVAAFLAALRLATDAWLDADQAGDPLATVEEYLDEMAAPFT
jgi:AcrR family transcriptional regulator